MSDLLTPAELAEIAEREAKATAGPWAQQSDGWTVRTESPPCRRVCITYFTTTNPAEVATQVFDAEFIAHARTDIPALLRHIAALEAREPKPKVVRVIFDSPPSHESGRFVECEDEQGRSIHAGEWKELENGLWELRIEVANESI